MKIVSTILAFSQVKKEILKVAPLEVDQGDPPTSGVGVLMMHDLYVYFSYKTKRKCSLDNLVLGINLGHVETLTKTSLEFT